METSTHIAFSDESHFNVGRYRSIGVVSLEISNLSRIQSDIVTLLNESGMSEFSWKKVIDARGMHAANKLIKYSLKKAVEGSLRVDVLKWDTHDSRHNIVGRDDKVNFHIMYYRAIKDVLCKRWPDESRWILHPDEQSLLDWDSIESHLLNIQFSVCRQLTLLNQNRFNTNYIKEFDIAAIEERASHKSPIIQIADLYAGMSAYSRKCFCSYQYWSEQNNTQMLLVDQMIPPESYTETDRMRCNVLSEFKTLCKSYKLNISLESTQGLQTHNPSNPINIWLYKPQHENDQAPIRTVRR